jgi:hypothetical protein
MTATGREMHSIFESVVRIAKHDVVEVLASGVGDGDERVNRLVRVGEPVVVPDTPGVPTRLSRNF